MKKGAKSLSDFKAEYASSPGDWRRFLACWRATVDQRLQREKGWSGLVSLPMETNGISDINSEPRDQLDATERRLQTRLPVSFRDFTLASKGMGWFIEATGGVGVNGRPEGGLWPIGKIGLFREVNPTTYKTWVQNSPGDNWTAPPNYFSYGYQEEPQRRQDSAHMNVSHLHDAIQVGDLDQGGVILLNPAEKTSDGEMEAWTLSFQTHVVRYRSFAELMQHMAYFDGAPGNAQSAIHAPNIYVGNSCIALLQTAATPR